MAFNSVIGITNNSEIFKELQSNSNFNNISFLAAPNFIDLATNDLDMLFNPIAVIDLNDIEKGNLIKTIERLNSQYIPYFFIIDQNNNNQTLDYVNLKPSGFFTEPLLPHLCFANFQQAMHNISVNKLKNKKLEELFVKSGKDYVRISADEILWIQANGNYIEIFTTYDKSYLLRIGLKDIEERLPEDQFLRVHKSYIVHKKHILKFNSNSIRTQQGEVPLARSYFNSVLAAFTVI